MEQQEYKNKKCYIDKKDQENKKKTIEELEVNKSYQNQEILEERKVLGN